MPYVIVRHKVEDVTKWKPLFDKGADMLKAAGMEARYVFHNVDDSNDVVILFEVDDIEKSRQLGQTDELKETMKKHGVTGPVERIDLETVE